MLPGEPKSKVSVELIIATIDELETKGPDEPTMINATDDLTLGICSKSANTNLSLPSTGVMRSLNLSP